MLYMFVFICWSYCHYFCIGSAWCLVVCLALFLLHCSYGQFVLVFKNNFYYRRTTAAQNYEATFTFAPPGKFMQQNYEKKSLKHRKIGKILKNGCRWINKEKIAEDEAQNNVYIYIYIWLSPTSIVRI